MACHIDPEQVSELGFSDDPTVQRFLLPGETTSLAIIRELSASGNWPVNDWNALVPKDTVARLTLARLLREQGKPEAQNLLGQILDAGQELSAIDNKYDRAIRLAMRAEAQASALTMERGRTAISSGDRPDSGSHDQAVLVV